ncbi:MAG: DUF2335 domain-containing protein [Rickettsiales bacterium]|nr:DUF2335 domain-containing protein [Rickettsiales bacterium]
MKESRKFFENNRLNKGYSRIVNFNRSDQGVIRRKYKSILPPIDLIEEYEELYPGTFEKILDMAQKEQNHMHSMDLLEMERHNRATKLGRLFSLLYVAIISVTTLILALNDNVPVAAMFATASFSVIVVVSYLYSKTSKRKMAGRHFNHDRKKFS